MLSSSILKWLFVNMLVYHIFMVIALKTPIYYMIIIKLFTWFTNLFRSYGITMFNIYYNLVDATNFIKIKIISILFMNIFAFLIWCSMYFFWHKYNITSYEIKKCSFFGIWLLWVLTYHNMQNTMRKSLTIMTWLKFKHGTPIKQYNVTTILVPLVVCFHPLVKLIPFHL
jgi:hypothetical protein